MKEKDLVKYSKIGLVFLVVLFASVDLRAARANAAPPPPASGSDIRPSIGNTMVRMVSEVVVLEIAADGSRARVTGEYFMRNLGEETEQMLVRYPMNLAEYNQDNEFAFETEYCEYTGEPTIENLAVWVDGGLVPVEVSYETFLDVIHYPADQEVYVTVPCWAHFDVIFPPGEDVAIKVTYDVPTYDYSGTFEMVYVISTGSGWYDTIGAADIVMRLPYAVSDLNISRCDPDACTLTGTEVAWHFEDFEPARNIRLEAVKPGVWERILTEQANVQANPNDGEAWGRLGMAYQEAGSSSSEIYTLSYKAFQRALELMPDNADWQFGLAKLFCGQLNSGLEFYISCAQQLKLALDINPYHEGANGLMIRLDDMYKNGGLSMPLFDLSGPQPDFVILTPQPTSTPTATATDIPASPTPLPTAASIPSSTPTQQASQSVESGSGFVWVIFLGGALLLAGVVIVVLGRRKA